MAEVFLKELEAGYKQGEYDGNYYGIIIGMGIYWDQSNLVYPYLVATNNTHSYIDIDVIIDGVQSASSDPVAVLTSDWVYLKIIISEKGLINFYYTLDRYGPWTHMLYPVQLNQSIYQQQPSMYMIGSGWHKG